MLHFSSKMTHKHNAPQQTTILYFFVAFPCFFFLFFFLSFSFSFSPASTHLAGDIQKIDLVARQAVNGRKVAHEVAEAVIESSVLKLQVEADQGPVEQDSHKLTITTTRCLILSCGAATARATQAANITARRRAIS